MFPLDLAVKHLQEHYPDSWRVLAPKLDLSDSADRQPLLDALSESLLDPQCTIAVCASFRPILLDLASRLLRLVRQVEHLEQLCTTAALPLLQYGPSCLLNMLLSHLRASELSPFDRASSHQLELPVLRRLAAAGHQLLLRSRRFAEVCNWEPLLSLIRHSDADVRYEAACATALFLNMSDAEQRQFGPLNEDPQRRLARVAPEEKHEAGFVALEWDMLRPSAKASGSALLGAEDLSDDVVSVCGVLLPRRRSEGATGAAGRLVYTESAVGNMQAIALALSRGRPVVVAGDAGAGKSALLGEVARLTGNGDMLSIHLGDQTDAKSLLGTYVCTEVPGEFRWQPGALTQAVTTGLWVLIEDIDLAPMDVVSVLIPLLESRRLFIPGRGEEVPAADGFQLLATQSMAGGRRGGATSSFLTGLWTRVMIEPLSSPELVQVLSQLYPGMAHHAATLVKARDNLMESASRSLSQRFLSARDVKKWFHRVNTLHPAIANGLRKPLTTEGRRRVFVEALDCFTGMLAPGEARSRLRVDLGAALGVGQEMVEQQIQFRRPELQVSGLQVTVGRALPLSGRDVGMNSLGEGKRPFVLTRHALRTLELVAVAVALEEPVLCVGETGVGKTAAIQHLASLLNQELVVVNLNQQSDSADLLGSFRPLEMRVLCVPLRRRFDQLFARSFSQTANKAFLDSVDAAFTAGDWKRFLALLRQAQRLRKESSQQKKRKVSATLESEWEELSASIGRLEVQQRRLKQSFAFAFVEGTLVEAVRHGRWILLDEINLASADMLECVSGLLEGESLLLAERGDTVPIERHPNFRLFACMNPSTNAGRKDLPPGLRNRFSEFFIDECEAADDLQEIVHTFMRIPSGGDVALSARIVDFYLTARGAAGALRDGAGRTPKFSLRSLIRALEYARSTAALYGLSRSLYEGICMTFLTQLDVASQAVMSKTIRAAFPPGPAAQLPRNPGDAEGARAHVRVQHFWIEVGDLEPAAAPRYILTRTITKHLKNLARVVVTRRYPALLQGPTASGKTSMVEYLAAITGHRFVRINNHEHTDISEYMGSYVSDENGRLVFREGVLVEAVRKGYWIVLDELNLAPSDVLESLNRLLDDNRELFIPETQEVVKPHPHFALFATQNPPGLYGGRKVLSPAFSNRFLELHFDDLPDEELQEILQRRCELAPSYAAKLVEVMRDLQRRRQSSQIFAGKHGFITLRDLFKWAERQPIGYQQLAEEGYMLLAERLRSDEEKAVIRTVLEAHMPGAKLEVDGLYKLPEEGLQRTRAFLEESSDGAAARIVWTHSFQRMFTLVRKCIRNKEPVLLIGGTGCGKTSVCQVLAALMEQELRILNLHEHSETADFLGGLRPLRDRQQRGATAVRVIVQYLSDVGSERSGEIFASAADAVKAFHEVARKQGSGKNKTVPSHKKAKAAIREYETLFTWNDGPLVEAMKKGQMMLLDEIALAEDAVLERLNSVLESGRTLLLAEKGGSRPQQLRAHSDFRILATMNPGGDFGKRELSPALRNRFTEIWVPPISRDEDISAVVLGRIEKKVTTAPTLVEKMLRFGALLREHQVALNLRDFLSWADFLASSAAQFSSPGVAFLHGAFLVCLDGLAVASSHSPEQSRAIRERAVQFVAHDLFPDDSLDVNELHASSSEPRLDGSVFRVGPFSLEAHPGAVTPKDYSLSHGTTLSNLLRVMRACALSKPILLEGSPGQGKTTLITALAKQTGRRVVRINLSEETDMMDLLGADLPVEGGAGGEFHWQDGVFLQALRQGDWVLLDELNLASQSILEGLNSVLDHRASVFVPELNQSFACPPSFRIFACQNPSSQGGGRKGLPKSFLNRFTKVYMDALSAEDMHFIASTLYQGVPEDHLRRLIAFNESMHYHAMVKGSFAHHGRPWEFNLRDVLRCCQVYDADAPLSFYGKLYRLRLREESDRAFADRLLAEQFEGAADRVVRFWKCTPESFRVGRVTLPRQQTLSGGAGSGSTVWEDLVVLKERLPELEALAGCVRERWMPILVGGAASGKTALVHTLARLTGNSLQTFEMNAGVDTTELLGGFEQMDLAHHRRELLRELDGALMTASRRDCLSTGESQVTQRILMLRESLKKPASSSTGGRSEGFTQEEESVVRQLLALVTECAHLEQKLDLIQQAAQRKGAAAFEWRDGLLIRALERGDWLLVDNVNFCNPAVLDRLNPLLEPGGELTVNERGLVNGQLRVVVPHPNFRIFLAMDPRHGEVSRPMRNRGVEVVLFGMQQDDAARLAVQHGGNHGLSGRMAMFHNMVAVDPVCTAGQSLTVRDLLAWAEFTSELRRRGAGERMAVRAAMEHVYLRNRRSAAQRQAILAHYASWRKQRHLLGTSIVPALPDLTQLRQDSRAAQVVVDGVFLGQELGLYAGRMSEADLTLRSLALPQLESLLAVPLLQRARQEAAGNSELPFDLREAVLGHEGTSLLAVAMRLSDVWTATESRARQDGSHSSIGRSWLHASGQLGEEGLSSRQEALLWPVMQAAHRFLSARLAQDDATAQRDKLRKAADILCCLWEASRNPQLGKAQLAVLWKMYARAMDSWQEVEESDEVRRLSVTFSESMGGREWEAAPPLARVARGLQPMSAAQANLAVRLLACDMRMTGGHHRALRTKLMELASLVLGVSFRTEEEVTAATLLLEKLEQAMASDAQVVAVKEEDGEEATAVVDNSGVLVHGPDGVLPVADLLSLRWEHSLLAAEEDVQNLTHFSEWGVEETGRPPVDFAPYRLLWWAQAASREDAGLWESLHRQCRLEMEHRWLRQVAGTTDGSLSLVRDVPTLMVASLTDVSDVPLQLAGSKGKQLGALFALLLSAEPPAGAPLPLEFRRLEASLARAVDAYRSRCTSDGARAGVDQFASRLVAATLCNGCGSEEEAQLLRLAFEAVRSVADDRLRDCCDSLWQEWVEQVVQVVPEPRPTVAQGELARRLSVAWVRVGLALMMLLAPGSGVDPAARYAVKADFLSERASQSERRLNARLSLERWCNGVQRVEDAACNIAAELEAEFVSDQQAAIEAAAKVQSRGKDAPDFSLLYGEVDRFCKSFGAVDRLKRVWQELQEGKASGFEGERQFQAASQRFLDGLEEKFSSYRDVTVPLASAVLNIKFGLRLLAEEQSEARSALVNNLLAAPCCVKVAEGLRSLLTECSATEDVLSLGPGLFEALLAWAELGVKEANGQPSAGLLKALSALFSAFARTWALARQREAEAKAEREATIKFATSTVATETDEEKEERLYRQMFPAYSEAFSDLAPDDAPEDFGAVRPMDVGDEEDRDEDTKLQRGKSLASILLGRSRGALEEHLLEVCRLHARVFAKVSSTGSVRFESGDLVRACQTSYSAAVYLVAQEPGRWHRGERAVPLDWHLFAVSRARTELARPPLAPMEIDRRLARGPSSFSLFEVGTTTTIADAKRASDVYREPNPDEGRLILEPLLGLKERVRTLLDEWPEHAILLTLNKCIERLLRTSWKEPLMKLVRGLEYLTEYAQQWEQNAASHVSLEPHLGQAARLILRWRKLELLSWPRILQARVQVHEMTAMHWWFHFERVLEGAATQAPDVDDSKQTQFVGETLDIVLDWVQSATLGDFRARLALLASFGRQLAAETTAGIAEAGSARAVLAVALDNTHQYFAQFVDAHEENWKSSTEDLDQQIRDFLKLIKWDSSSYLRLRETAEKSKRKVGRFAKKMDELLRVSMGPAVFMRIDESIVENDAEKAAGKRKKQKKGKTAPPALSRVPEIQASEFLVAIPEVAEEDVASAGGEVSRSYRVPTLVKRMHSVMEDTFQGIDAVEATRGLEELTETLIEGMESLQGEGVEKRQKRLGLQQLLKELAENGLSYRTADYNVQQQSLAFLVQVAEGFSSLPDPLARLPHAEFLDDALQRGSKYMWKIAARLAVARKQTEKAPPDLDRRQVLLLIGYSENFLAIALRGRQCLGRVLEELSALHELAAALEGADGCPQERATQLAGGVLDALRVADRAGTFQLEATPEQARPLTSIVGRCKAFSEVLRQRLAQGSIIPWTKAQVQHLESCIGALEQFVQISSRLNLPAHGQTMLQEAVDRCRSIGVQWRAFEESSEEFTVTAESAQAVEAAVDSVLLSVQGISKLEKNAGSGITARSKQLEKEVAALALERSLSAVRQAVTLGGPAGRRIAPLVRQLVFVAMRWAVERAAEWTAAGKFGYVFLGIVSTLLLKGFCRKEEEDGDGKGEFSWEDDVEGTGMGEGQGKDDVSKQIEDPEEQLMGTTNEKKEEGGNEKEEEDGIDMELDFDGNMHDMDSGEEPDEDEEKEQEDREMDDEKQDDVVDEKMWDDPSEDEDDKKGQGDEPGQDTFEKDDPLQLQDGMDLEMAGKQDEDGDDEEDENRPNEEQPKKDEAGDKEEGEDGEEDDEPEDMPEHDPQGQTQQQDEVVDKQANVQEPDDFELPPDEMEMSSELNENEEGSAMEISGEGDDDKEDEEGDGQEEEEEEEEEHVADGKEDGVEPEEEAEEDMPVPGPLAGADDEEKKDDEEAAPEGERGEEADKRDPQEEDEREGAEYGVRERGAGAVELQGTGDASKAEAEDDDKPKSSGPGDADQEAKGAAGGGEDGGGGEGATQEGHSQQMSRERRKPQGPNPLRELGEALKRMHRNVEAEEKDVGEDAGNKDVTGDAPRPEVDERQPSPTRAEFDEQGAEQALGPATDEQLKQQDATALDAEEEDDKAVQEVADEEGQEDDDAERVGPDGSEAKPLSMPDVTDDLRKQDEEDEEGAAAAAVPVNEEADGEGQEEQLSTKGFGALEPMDLDEDEEESGQDELFEEDLPPRTLEDLRAEMEARLLALGEGERAAGEELWQQCALLTRGLAAELAEQLRLLLVPSRATSLEGDFRTGKRINMKRVIPYIASDFKKDKIWLRRKKPTKRCYQIMVAIDDSKSMRDHRKGQMALEALATITTALTTLEAGQLAVAKFGSGTELLHAFDNSWSDARGAEVCGAFSFGEAETNVHGLLHTMLGVMSEQRENGSGREEHQQLAFVVTDGLLTSRGAELSKLVGRAAEEGVMLVVVLIDNQGEGSGSVLDIQSIVQHKGRMARKAYMDSFPFQYYVVLKELTELPRVLADALRQWIELMDH